MRRDKDRLRSTWRISDRRGATLADDLQILLGDLCRTSGFCNALADDILAENKVLTAEAFATAVLTAEGWADPQREYEWRPQFVRLFTGRYGPEISAAEYDGG
jgi:hypothetical protein